MSHRTPYTYTVLRYRHDAVAGECVNVGVVMHSAQKGFLESKLSFKYGRLHQVFPDLDSAAFRESLHAIERGVRKLAKRERGDMLAKLASADSISYNVLHQDDSSFLWSSVGSGVAADLDAELEKLFKRFVTWHEQEKSAKRSDEDVWKPVRERLVSHQLADRLEKKVVSSDRTSVEFDHTWRNGALHCYQPLSLDLASKESIQDKVARWSGHLFHLRTAAEDFKTYFIVGRPSDPKLQPAYAAAIAALKDSPKDPEVYEESQVDEFVKRVEDEMRAHDAQLGGAN